MVCFGWWDKQHFELGILREETILYKPLSMTLELIIIAKYCFPVLNITWTMKPRFWTTLLSGPSAVVVVFVLCISLHISPISMWNTLLRGSHSSVLGGVHIPRIVNSELLCVDLCSALGNGDLVRAKWESLLPHILNRHVHDNPLFPECLHGQLEDRAWLQEGTMLPKFTS